MDFLKNMMSGMMCEEYAEGRQNIDELIEDINEIFNQYDKDAKRKSYEEKLGYEMVRIEILQEILKLKKFKKKKQDGLKIYKMYLQEVKELGKIFDMED